MDRIVVGQRVPVPAARLPPGTPTGSTPALKLRLLRPDRSAAVITAPHSLLVQDRVDRLLWQYMGIADREGIWEWQWELDRVVLDYGKFFVRGTGFSS